MNRFSFGQAKGPIGRVLDLGAWVDAEAPEDGGREVAWRDVLSNARRAANGLLELGVRPGERVAILLGNCPEFLWAHLGIGFIGAASVPVNICWNIELRNIASNFSEVDLALSFFTAIVSCAG